MNGPPLDVWVVGVVALGLLSLGSGLVASIEIAFLGLPSARIEQAVRARLAGAEALAAVAAAPARTLATLHLLRVLCLIGGGMAMGMVAQSMGWRTFELVTVGAVAVLLWIPAYLIPRALAKQHALSWARFTILPVRVVTVLMTPIVWPLVAASNAATRLLGGAHTAFWTPDEIGELSARARSESLGERNEAIFDSILEFSDTVIREIMVPRTEMMALPVSATSEEIRRAVVDGGHSRIPVYDETVDNVVGLLHVKDMVRLMAESGVSFDTAGPEIELRDILRATFYVPEVMKITELLREFQRRKTHMAIVVDEYGGTAGVVTLEDIIEEIVGEIHDEYDVEEKQFRILSDNKILADGRVQVYDLETVLGVDFPEEGGFETLAGFLMFQAGYLPQSGAVIHWNGLRFTIKEANEKRIGTVEIEKGSRLQASGEQASGKSA